MNINIKNGFKNILAAFAGLSVSFLGLEGITRILHASASLPLQLPLNCENIEQSVNLSCVLRRIPYRSGLLTKGTMPPHEISAFKASNDIGMFSNVDFSDLSNSADNVLKIISIGDSYVEAVHVPNEKSFHGLLNQKKYVERINKPVLSTLLASGGNAAAQYFTDFRFAVSSLQSDNTIFVFYIAGNDFYESYPEYKDIKIGTYFKRSKSGFDFYPYTSNFKIALRRFVLRNSSTARYLAYNMPIASMALKYPFCLFLGSTCTENTITTPSDTLEDYNKNKVSDAKKGVDRFLGEMVSFSKNRVKKTNIIFLVDSIRDYIYHDHQYKESPYSQRNYFIKQAKKFGFRVLDMKPVFEKDYALNSVYFNFRHDGHFNEYGHSILAEEITRLISDP
ncbi:hypothetical protein [Prochlorococcus sp. MIT 1341]|uniref:hypothetical protein n=1 Tax=Prochlorococcus sp. MIT 1341 TaxID=3096221 RepID=UPI002A749EFF|nr:hypothetical protein [Prochlorococcus sp. MIT 1341]